MKSVIYISKGRLWLDGRAFEWSKDSLSSVLVSVKKDLKINDVRIVLGSDLGYVIGVKLPDIDKARRDEVLRLAKGWLPFEVNDDCFDWKLIVLGESDIWAQVIAVDPDVLEILSQGIDKSGLRVDWMIPVGVILGDESLGKEVLVIVRWKDKEELLVLAQNGLVDYVGSESIEQLSEYAKQKWHLEVNPEQVILNKDNFDLNKQVLEGRNRGDDKDVLGLSLLKKKNLGIEQLVPKNLVINVMKDEPVIEERVPKSKPTVNPWLWGILALTTLVMVGVLWWNYGRKIEEKPRVITPTPTPTIVVTPESTPSATPAKLDLSLYNIQILNGSGVPGEASKLKDKLLTTGFVSVDTGNSSATESQTIVSYKSGFPAEALSMVMDSISSYEIGNVLFLTNDNKYDVVIVLGSSRKTQL